MNKALLRGLISVILLVNSCSGDKWRFKRDVKDVRDTLYMLCGDPHSERTLFKCMCVDDYDTIISNNKEKWGCENSRDLGCYHSLVDSKTRTYLFNESETVMKIYPHVVGVDTSKYQVYVWNTWEDYAGIWVDFTHEASNVFRIVSNSSKSIDYIEVANFDKKLWSGHLIKITFGKDNAFYKPCLTFKIRGEHVYPFDETVLRRELLETTDVPVVTTKTTRSGSSHATTTVTVTTTVSKAGKVTTEMKTTTVTTVTREE